MSQAYDPYARLQEMKATFESTQSRVAEIQASIAALTVEAEDPDGQLRATVGAAGVTDLHISPRAMRMASEELAERLVALIQRANADLQQQVQALTSDLVSQFPAPQEPGRDGSGLS